MKTLTPLHKLIIFLILFIISFFTIFNTISFSPIRLFDEAFYAVIAKEMLQHGNMLILTFGGERFFAASPSRPTSPMTGKKSSS